MTNIIEIKNAGIKYNIFTGDEKAKSWKEYWALRDININIAAGEAVALIGSNGSGKTTFLKMIAGILSPDIGTLEVKGKICGLLEIGSGFSAELSGYENIFLSAALLGMGKKEIKDKLSDIIAFADIGDFLYVPVKCYSQGMFVRLAFSIAVFCEPDILMVDDTFSVGDETFKNKAISKLYEFKQKGVTMVFATHDMGIVSDFGTKAVLLNKGQIEQAGDVRDVLNLYMHLNGTQDELGVLHSQDYKLIFNNGSIFLYYKDTEITTGLGGYFRFKDNGVKYDSSSFDWKMKKDPNIDIMCFRGKSLVSDAQIEILFEAKREGFVFTAKGSNDNNIEEVKFHFMLPCDYDFWKLKDQSGMLPQIKKENSTPLKILQENSINASFSLAAKKHSALPEVLFESLSDDYIYLVALNSGFRNFSRIVEIANQEHNFDNSFLIGFNCKKENIGRVTKNQTVIGNQLQIIVESGRCSFRNRDEIVFEAGAVYTSIYTDDNIYNSLTPALEILDFTDNQITLKIEHHRLNAYELWTLVADDELGFDFKAELFLEDDIRINNYTATFFASSEYVSWEGTKDSGMFPNIFLKEHWSDFLQRNITGGKLQVAKKEGNHLLFSADNSFFRIFNIEKKISGKHRIVQCFSFDEASDSKRQVSLNINPGTGAVSKKNNGFKNSIEKDRYRVVFVDNTVRFMKDGCEVTSQLGVYTSYFAKDRWNASSEALWKVESITEDTMVLTNKFKVIPVQEKWHIKILEGKISIELSVEILHSCRCSFFQFNVMTAPKYDSFLGKDSQVLKFPKFVEETGPQWAKVFDASENVVAVFGEDMPDISLDVEKKDQEGALSVLNTDVYYRTRVMQFLKEIKEVKSYMVFKGVVK